MRGSEADYGVSSGAVAEVEGEGAEVIINAGQTNSLEQPGYLVWLMPGCRIANPHQGEPLTGEPDAGEPPVRFGGRGDRNQSVLPTPIGTLPRKHYCSDPRHCAFTTKVLSRSVQISLYNRRSSGRDVMSGFRHP